MEDPKSIGTQVLEQRLKLNLSQNELGEKAGQAGSYISKIERDLVMPKGNTMILLARALGRDLVISPDLQLIEMRANGKLEGKDNRSNGRSVKSITKRTGGPKPPDDKSKWLKLDDVAAMYKKHRRTIQKKLRDWRVPYIQKNTSEPRWYSLQALRYYFGTPGVPRTSPPTPDFYSIKHWKGKK